MRCATKSGVVVMAVLALVVVAADAKAELYVDQGFALFNYSVSTAGGGIAQTFTAGLDGQLTAVAIEVQQLHDATLSISWTGSPDAVPVNDSAVVASVALPDVDGLVHPTWIEVDLAASNIQVLSGESLAIILSGGYEVWDAGLTLPGPGYTGGTSFYFGGACPSWLPMTTEPFGYDNFGFDFDFETFVNIPESIASVSEPSTLAPALIGGVLIAVRMRRGNQRTEAST